MYNRYIPQQDGSYQRNRMAEPAPPPNPAPPPPPPPEPPRQEPQPQHPHYPRPQEQGVGGFLRQLLPKNFDTADLLIVLLILLMAGDCQEDQNTALLTLALYFFL